MFFFFKSFNISDASKRPKIIENENNTLTIYDVAYKSIGFSAEENDR